MIVTLKMAAVIGCLAVLNACDRHVRAEKEMTWNCKPDMNYNGQQWVEFHFVENPHYFHTEVGPYLCDELKSLGGPTVTMKFDLLGDFFSGFRGSSSIGIKGLATPFSDRNAGVESAGTTQPGVDPLQTAYEHVARR